MTKGCPFREQSVPTPSVDFDRFHRLHSEGKRLVRGWFERAYSARENEDECFEAFIFAWFAVNGWAACVTEKDRDSDYIKSLQRSNDLAAQFHKLLEHDAAFRDAATSFQTFWPIFKAQALRLKSLYAPSDNRIAVVEHYLAQGMTEYEPECWQSHREAGEPVPLDWPHTLAAIYRVRCNLFHGEKSAHSEMDRAIVRAAYLTLIGFFRGAEIL